ncbi:MAG: N(4)-(beta-N-acetylglucosaminyl)-L-asparaginase [Bacteroidota bacterium]
MSNRRSFLKKSAFLATLLGASPLAACSSTETKFKPTGKPVIISTWNHGIAANAAAWGKMKNGGTVVEAIEAGVKVPESDPNIMTIGYGGLPDRDGHVTLDACIMDPSGNCGSVAGLEFIENPISVARMVMNDTPHVMLVGNGALQFALENGFEKKDLLTEKAREAWEKWLVKAEYKPIINIENHDTIGLLAQDANGDIAGACTTSGLAYKMHGRVGDSPIIGAGLFVDNEIGGATATGMGEAIVKVAGSHSVVELMRQGYEPEEACKEVVKRITRKEPNYKNLQAGFIAIRKDGKVGGYAIQKGFNYALMTSEEDNKMVDATHML